MEFIPLKDFMVIEKVEQPLESGLVVPDTVSDIEKGGVPEEIFKIVKVGEDVIKEADLKVGDLIAIVGYLTHIRYKKQKVMLARARDVVVKIKE